VLAEKQRLRSLRGAFDRADGVEYGESRRLPRPVRQRRRIERENVGSASGLLSLVKALTALLPNRSLLDQPGDDRRQREQPGLLGGQLSRQVTDDVTEHVETGDVHRAEGRALGSAERRPRDRVDVFDRELAGFERGENPDYSVQPDPISDEIRRVFSDDDAFAEVQVGEAGHPGDDVPVRVGRWYDFEEREVPRRVKEVRPQPMPPEFLAAAVRDGMNRNTGRVRRHDRAWVTNRFDFLEERTLDVKLFDDGFEDPVDRPERADVAVQPAGGDACS